MTHNPLRVLTLDQAFDILKFASSYTMMRHYLISLEDD